MLTRPRFWSLLPSTILDWVVIIVSISLSVDATKHADTSRECYLEYFACCPHRTDLLLVGAHEHYSGCTSLHLRKPIITGVTHHPPAWHTSHIYISLIIIVSVLSTICEDTTTHNTPPPLREGKKLDVLETINYSAHETETCQGQFNISYILHKWFLFVQMNQSESDQMLMVYQTMASC